MTEDIRMNDFAMVTDAAYFYAEAANGSQTKIDIEDAIKALGGLPLERSLNLPIYLGT